jgi:hypothetical protein
LLLPLLIARPGGLLEAKAAGLVEELKPVTDRLRAAGFRAHQE